MDCDEASVQADKATVAGSAVYHAAMPTRGGPLESRNSYEGGRNKSFEAKRPMRSFDRLPAEIIEQ